MPEEIKTKCDMLIVNAGGKAYLVEAEPNIANIGDLVDIQPQGEDLKTGWVEDIFVTQPYGELYCFLSRLATIHAPLAVYTKTWHHPTLYDEL